MRHLNKGQGLTDKELKEIAENYIVTKHAQQRIAERFSNLDIHKAILYPTTAFFHTDGTVYIGLNGYEHLVVDIEANNYKVVTIKRKSFKGVTIFDKQTMAQKGYKDRYRTEKINK